MNAARRGLFLWLLMLLAAACVATGQHAPIAITISSPSAKITSGCGLLISIELENRMQTLLWAGPLFPGPPNRPAQGAELFHVYATGPHGRPVPASAYAKALAHEARVFSSLRNEPIKPRGTLHSQAIVTEMYDLSDPGQYKIWVTLKSGPYSRVRSNVLTVTVEAPN